MIYTIIILQYVTKDGGTLMLNEKIANLLNEQVNKELYSGYLYLEFANYYADEGLDGFAHWYEIQEIGRASCRERV